MEKSESLRVTRINKLKLFYYRNHKELRIDTDKNFVLFYGRNGTGKTNILEAVSLLSSKTGFRNSDLQSLIYNFDIKKILNFGVNIEIMSQNKLINIGVGLVEKNKRVKKFIKFQKKNTEKNVEDIFKIFWVLPNMNNLFQSKSKDRRDFVDAMISSLDRTHNKRIKIYENLQRQRISILKDFSTTKSNIRWLDIIEREMASQAIVISEKRMNLYDLLNQILDDQIEQLPRIKVFAISGIEEQLKNVPALTIEEEICKQLTENRKIDGLIGKTQYSAINSDFKIQNFEKNTDARNCSTGEQKVILLSIFFSFIKMLKKQDIKEIIFLLDDIFSNLDQRYAELILRSLSELNVQTWITDIEMKIINEESIFYNQTKFINIEDIQVKK